MRLRTLDLRRRPLDRWPGLLTNFVVAHSDANDFCASGWGGPGLDRGVAQIHMFASLLAVAFYLVPLQILVVREGSVGCLCFLSKIRVLMSSLVIHGGRGGGGGGGHHIVRVFFWSVVGPRKRRLCFDLLLLGITRDRLSFIGLAWARV